MNTHFSIPPWEFRGSNQLETAHAQAELEIGGTKRTLLLKMREGVIYFKEPNRVPAYAVTKQFERELRGEELVETWREETRRENYGRFVVYNPSFPDTSVGTVLAMIHRADHSGWVREWFRPNWLEIPRHRDGKQLDLWGNGFQNATRRAFRHTHKTLLDCALSTEERPEIAPNWKRGDEAELNRVFALVMRLYARRKAQDSNQTWDFAACNPASKGGFADTFSSLYHLDLEFSPSLGALRHLIEQEFVWAAMEWKHFNSKFDSFNANHAALQKWGEHWRGNYGISTPHIGLTVPLVAHLSSHEKLESLLELREWLSDKTTAKQSAHLLAGALD